MQMLIDEVIAGSAPDVTVSADAMRWSPPLAGPAGGEGVEGVDCSTGLAAELRPWLVRAMRPFAEVAVDMLDELRGLHGPGAFWRGLTRP